jgi:hypothetical protein
MMRTELFHWHPLLMTISFIVLMPFSTFYMLLPLPGFVKRRTAHICLQTLASSLAFAGFAVMYTKKGVVLHSFHSYFGAAAFLVLLVQSFSGLRLSSLLPKAFSSLLRRKPIKCFHYYAGFLLLVLGFLSLQTALFSRWFVNGVAYNYQWWLCSIGLIIHAFGTLKLLITPRTRQKQFEWAFRHS